MKIKTSDFFNGIISLIISQALIKIFGVVYTLYLTNKSGFGDSGNAIYMSGYQIYALLLTISSIGVPSAISKLISEKLSIKDYKNSNRIFLISIFLFSSIGFLGSIILFCFSRSIAEKVLQISESTVSLMALSPAIFFVSISSVIRGYFNGENQISITAKSQLFEQLIKSFFTIIFVEYLSKRTSDKAILAAGANFATTFATIISLIYISLKYVKLKRKKDSTYYNRNEFPKERIYKIIKSIFIVSFPITISAILSSLGRNIDSITIVRILKNIIGEKEAIRKYGILSFKVDVLIALPLAFNNSISTALIPEIARKKTIGDLDGIVERIEFSIFLTVIIGIPCMFGLYFYSNQIFELLFPRAKEGAHLLKLAALGIIFPLLTQTINGILQGIGKNKEPVYAALIGIVVKTISNLILVPIYNVYEKGAIIGNVLANIVNFFIVYVILKKNLNIKIKISFKVLLIFLSSTIMIFLSYNLYNILILKNVNVRISALLSIGFAVIIYIFVCFRLNLFKKITEKAKL